MSPTLIINHHDDDEDDEDDDDDGDNGDDDQPESGRHGGGSLLDCRDDNRSRSVDPESKLTPNPGIGTQFVKQQRRKK